MDIFIPDCAISDRSSFLKRSAISVSDGEGTYQLLASHTIESTLNPVCAHFAIDSDGKNLHANSCPRPGSNPKFQRFVPSKVKLDTVPRIVRQAILVCMFLDSTLRKSYGTRKGGDMLGHQSSYTTWAHLSAFPGSASGGPPTSSGESHGCVVSSGVFRKCARTGLRVGGADMSMCLTMCVRMEGLVCMDFDRGNM